MTGIKDDSGGVMNDRCSKGAYYGGGTWWLDRWLLGRSDIVVTHVRGWDCRENGTLAVDRETNLLTLRIVQPSWNKNIGSGVPTPNIDNDINCSGPGKR